MSNAYPPQQPYAPGPHPMPPQPPRRSSNTCLWAGLIGCLVLVILAIIAVVGGIFAFRGVVRMAAEEWTSPEPMELPQVVIPPEEAEQVRQRFDAFKQNVAAGVPAEPLVLTTRDLNALVQSHPDFRPISNSVYLSVEDDRLKGQISLPLEQVLGESFMGVPLAGRYLNGAATFDIFINNGALFVQLDSLEVRGNPVPDEAMMQMRNENLLRNVRDPNLQRIVDNLESIQIEGDTLTVVPKNAAPAPTPEAPAPDVQPEESVSAPAEQPVEPEPAPTGESI